MGISRPRRTRCWAALILSAAAAFGVNSCTAPDPPLAAPLTTPSSSTSAIQTGPDVPAGDAAISQPTSDDICSGGAGAAVDAPLATYGDTDSAELRFAGGAPPTARLCGSFISLGNRQEGSAASTSSPLAYLFSLVQTGKVSTGGAYYWIGGATDASVDSIVITFAETPHIVTVTLVPLSPGWRGFAFEYSPGPSYYSTAGPDGNPPLNAGLTVTARDHAGETVASRYINLDTNAQHEASAPTS